jgi:hypothetical protein
MNITITAESIYFGAITILLILQIYQQYKLDKAQKEIKQLWDQISVLATTTVLKIVELKKDINKVEEKIK